MDNNKEKKSIAMMDYIREVFQDINDGFSFKRFATFIALLLMVIGFIANLFWGFKVDEELFDAIMYIVIAGIGFTGAEHFAPKDHDDDN